MGSHNVKIAAKDRALPKAGVPKAGVPRLALDSEIQPIQRGSDHLPIATCAQENNKPPDEVQLDGIQSIRIKKQVVSLSTISRNNSLADNDNTVFVTSGPQFNILRRLGFGGSSIVYSAANQLTGETMAAKIVNKHSIKENLLSLSRNEIFALKSLIHPNIIKFHGYRESDHALVILLEMADEKNLFEYIVDNAPLTERLARDIFVQIMDGLQFAHKHKIVHRDVKPENLLLKFTGSSLPHVLIADWNFCGFIPDTKLLSDPFGTPLYAAPELLIGAEYDGTLIDVWSAGVVLYLMVVNEWPFDSTNIRSLFLKILTEEPSYPSFLSPNIIQLFCAMFMKVPTERANFSDLRKYAWMNEETTYL